MLLRAARSCLARAAAPPKLAPAHHGLRTLLRPALLTRPQPLLMPVQPSFVARYMAQFKQLKRMEAATAIGATPDAGLRSYRPTSPGRRHRVVIDKRGLWPGRPVKRLTKRIQMRAGRSRTTGKITIWGRSAAKHKRIYRKVDFHRKREDPAIVKRFEYDPNRSAFIALIEYESDKSLSYILAPQGLKVGDTVQSNDDAPFAPGNAMPLEFIPDGTLIHNIERIRGMGGKIARAAGTGAKVQSKDGGFVILKMQSGELRKIKGNCLATIGQVCVAAFAAGGMRNRCSCAPRRAQ